MFYTILKHAHSGIRWFVLIFLFIAIVNALIKMFGRKKYANSDKTMGVLALATTHIQLLIGLILYFISGKVIFSGDSMSNDLLRFFLVEHIGMMLISVVLITIGYVKTKRTSVSRKKHAKTFWFYFIALIIMLIAIPWPWQNYAA